MELTMKNGFCEMNEMEMETINGGGAPEAIAVGVMSVLGGAAVIALTPAKKTGAKIIAEGLLCAAGLYFV